MISVVLGEPTEAARDADTLALLRWGLGRSTACACSTRGGRWRRRTSSTATSSAALVPRRGAVLTIRDGQRVRRRANAPDEVEGRSKPGRESVP